MEAIKDLLKKIEELEAMSKESGSSQLSLVLTPRELSYVKIWVKTGYANEDALDEALGLKDFDFTRKLKQKEEE